MSTPAYAYGCQTPPNPPQVQYTQPCPDCAAMRQQLTDAQAQNAKLRDALQTIADHTDEGAGGGNPFGCDQRFCIGLEWAQHVANTALQETQP